jgi:hypothetical protein
MSLLQKPFSRIDGSTAILAVRPTGVSPVVAYFSGLGRRDAHPPHSRDGRAPTPFSLVGLGPIGVAVIFGVDELMDMGRTCVNLIGNCLATVVVARWEGEFDDNRAKVFGTPEEAALDLKSGDVAFADAVQQD